MLCLKTIKAVISKIKFITVSWLADQEILYSLQLVMCKQKDQKQYEHCCQLQTADEKNQKQRSYKNVRNGRRGGIWRNVTEMTINGTENGESQEKETTQKKIENASDIQSSFPLRTFNRCQWRVRISLSLSLALSLSVEGSGKNIG